jgi:transaldolase
MRIFINSADTNEIRTALASGFVYGVTINPTLLRQAGVHARQVPAVVKQIIEWGAKEVHLQTYAEKAADMLSEGRMLAAIDQERVVVRIPATPDGYAAGGQLTAQAIRVEMTAVYTLRQAMLANSIDASYIGVYLGRMRDTGMDELTQIGQIHKLLAAQYSQVKILAGSIRDPLLLETLGMQGIHAATMPITVLERLTEAPATAAAASVFRNDAEAILDAWPGVGGE